MNGLKTSVEMHAENDGRTESLISGLSTERVSEKTDPAPPTSVGSPA